MNRLDKPLGVSQQTLDPEGWLEKHGNHLYRFARFCLRNPELAKEKVQEIFVGALQTQARFQGLASERIWLTSILKRKILNHFRKISQERASNDTLLEKALQESSFDRPVKWVAGPNRWYWKPNKSLRQRVSAVTQCLSQRMINL